MENCLYFSCWKALFLRTLGLAVEFQFIYKIILGLLIEAKTYDNIKLQAQECRSKKLI